MHMLDALDNLLPVVILLLAVAGVVLISVAIRWLFRATSLPSSS